MKKTFLLIYILFFINYIPFGYTQTIIINGYSFINNNNQNKARENALLNAISNINKQTGQDLITNDIFKNKHININNMSLESLMNINNIQLQQQKAIDDFFKVTLQVSYNSVNNNHCWHPNLRSSILIPRAHIKDRSQLRLGQLQLFEQNISQKLGDTINFISRKMHSKTYADLNIKLDNGELENALHHIKASSSKFKNIHYLLVPKIIDISSSANDTSIFDSLLGITARNFHLQLSLFHGISGELIWQNHYQDNFDWSYSKDKTVAVNSNDFWQSTYGVGIKEMIAKMITDLDEYLDCRPVLGQIIAINDKLTINLGRTHGVKKNDVFNIVLQQNIVDSADNIRPIINTTDARLTINQVSQFSSFGKLLSDNPSLNIQIHDIVIAESSSQSMKY